MSIIFPVGQNPGQKTLVYPVDGTFGSTVFLEYDSKWLPFNC